MAISGVWGERRRPRAPNATEVYTAQLWQAQTWCVSNEPPGKLCLRTKRLPSSPAGKHSNHMAAAGRFDTTSITRSPDYVRTWLLMLEPNEAAIMFSPRLGCDLSVHMVLTRKTRSVVAIFCFCSFAHSAFQAGWDSLNKCWLLPAQIPIVGILRTFSHLSILCIYLTYIWHLLSRLFSCIIHSSNHIICRALRLPVPLTSLAASVKPLFPGCLYVTVQEVLIPSPGKSVLIGLDKFSIASAPTFLLFLSSSSVSRPSL